MKNAFKILELSIIVQYVGLKCPYVAESDESSFIYTNIATVYCT